MKDILYFNSLEDIKVLDMLRVSSKKEDKKEEELPNLIILTILSAGTGVVTPVFSKNAQGTIVFTSVDEIGTKFILDGKEITSDDFLIIEGKEPRFGLLFEDSNEHTLKISLINSTILSLTFFYNVFLIKVIISNSITLIGDWAFTSCTNLTTITIPNSVATIGDYAFAGCSGLTSVNIGNSVTEIGDNAFKDCTGLTSITIPDSVTGIGMNAFLNCSSLTSVTIGNTVTSIGDYAFYYCTGLTSVTIPNSVTSIGEYAFNECTGLTSVSIGNSVTTIDNAAFNSCSNLASITSLAATAPTISNNTFYGIKSEGTLHVPAGSDYSTWMSTSNYYLGKYNWTKVEDT